MKLYMSCLMVIGLCISVHTAHALDRWGDVVESKIDVVDTEVSQLDEVVDSRFDVVDASLNTIDNELSIHDEVVDSKIGDLDNSGSCLDSVIDVPADINNLTLNVIELLKTILLELRGGC